MSLFLISAGFMIAGYGFAKMQDNKAETGLACILIAVMLIVTGKVMSP